MIYQLYENSVSVSLRSKKESPPAPHETEVVRHNLGLKAPRGRGWLTHPKRAAYNRIYNSTSFGCVIPIVAGLSLLGLGFVSLLKDRS